MDLYGSDLKLSDIGLGDDRNDYTLNILDHQATDNFSINCNILASEYDTVMSSAAARNDLIDMHMDSSNNWLDSFLDDDQVFHDPLIADTNPFQPGRVKSEHSYSLANGEVLNLSTDYQVKVEVNDEKDFYAAIDPDLTFVTETTQQVHQHCDDSQLQQQAEDEEEELFVDSVTSSVELENVEQEEMIDCVKVEPSDDTVYSDTTYSASLDSDVYSSLVSLPPTPPHSNTSSSDSEAGGLTPTRSSPPSPISTPYTRQVSIRHSHGLWTATIQQPAFSTHTMPQSGPLFLTEEEKRTLIAEGYPIPSKLPLTKQEEKNLKKIRRKIKNKISAQESRRKKKEYLETLEKKVESVSQENSHLKKKVDILETNNRSLMSQLQRLQSLVNKLNPPNAATTSCVLVN